MKKSCQAVSSRGLARAKSLMVRSHRGNRESPFSKMEVMKWNIFRTGNKKPVLTVRARHQPAALLAAYKKIGGTASQQRELYARQSTRLADTGQS